MTEAGTVKIEKPQLLKQYWLNVLTFALKGRVTKEVQDSKL